MQVGQQKQQRPVTQPQGPLGRLALDSLTSAAVGTEVMQTLTGVASTSQSYQVSARLAGTATLASRTRCCGHGRRMSLHVGLELMPFWLAVHMHVTNANSPPRAATPFTTTCWRLPQVLDALSKAALLLRDTALGLSRGGSGQDSYTRAQLQVRPRLIYEIEAPTVGPVQPTHNQQR